MGNKVTRPTSSFNKHTTAMQIARHADLTGKVVLITGCNTGIGKHTAYVFAARGATVYMLCRNMNKANAARNDIIRNIQNNINSMFDASHLIVMHCDLSSLASVRQCALEYTVNMKRKIDILILNAGVANPPQLESSADGYEIQFAVNHLGHFYLANLLTPCLVQSQPSRIIVLTSNMAMRAPSLRPKHGDNFIERGLRAEDGPEWLGGALPGFNNYCLSKACNLLFAQEYNRRFSAQGVIAVAVHPGAVHSDIHRHHSMLTQKVFSIMSNKNIEQGAATTILCALMHHQQLHGGHFYSDCQDKYDTVRNDLKLFTNEDQEVKEQEQEQSGSSNYGKDLWRWSEMLILKKDFQLYLDQPMLQEPINKVNVEADDLRQVEEQEQEGAKLTQAAPERVVDDHDNEAGESLLKGTQTCLDPTSTQTEAETETIIDTNTTKQEVPPMDENKNENEDEDDVDEDDYVLIDADSVRPDTEE